MTELFSPLPPVRYRPLSLSVIGWYYFAGGIFGLLLLALPIPYVLDSWAALGADPDTFRMVGMVSGVIGSVSGWAILRRLAWGRILVLVYVLAGSAVVLVLMPAFITPGIVSGVLSLSVLGFLLTRPAANHYFDGTVVEEPSERQELRIHRRSQGANNDLGRVFAVILALAGALPLMGFAALLGTSRSFGEFSGSTSAMMGVALILLLVAAVVFFAGTLLWGYRRWMSYLGWAFVGCGFALCLSGLPLIFPFDPAVFQSPIAESPFTPEDFARLMRAMGASMLTWGFVLGAIGAPLVWYQGRRDRDSLGQVV